MMLDDETAGTVPELAGKVPLAKLVVLPTTIVLEEAGVVTALVDEVATTEVDVELSEVAGADDDDEVAGTDEATDDVEPTDEPTDEEEVTGFDVVAGPEVVAGLDVDEVAGLQFAGIVHSAPLGFPAQDAGSVQAAEVTVDAAGLVQLAGSVHSAPLGFLAQDEGSVQAEEVMVAGWEVVFAVGMVVVATGMLVVEEPHAKLTLWMLIPQLPVLAGGSLTLTAVAPPHCSLLTLAPDEPQWVVCLHVEPSGIP